MTDADADYYELWINGGLNATGTGRKIAGIASAAVNERAPCAVKLPTGKSITLRVGNPEQIVAQIYAAHRAARRGA